MLWSQTIKFNYLETLLSLQLSWHNKLFMKLKPTVEPSKRQVQLQNASLRKTAFLYPFPEKKNEKDDELKCFHVVINFTRLLEQSSFQSFQLLKSKVGELVLLEEMLLLKKSSYLSENGIDLCFLGKTIYCVGCGTWWSQYCVGYNYTLKKKLSLSAYQISTILNRVEFLAKFSHFAFFAKF